MVDKPGQVSIRTVAERAGVSTATVSNVLNGKPNVSAVFAERVRAAVGELGYVADGYASRLRSGRQALAGVVVPDLTNPMFAAFVSTLEHSARRDGFDLIVLSSANSSEEEAARLNNIRAWRPAGVIVIPCDGALADRSPAGAGWPIVVADRIPDSLDYDLIAVENREAAGRVAAHLAAQGFRRCLVVGSDLGISNVSERWDGVRDGCGTMDAVLLEVGVSKQGIAAAFRDHLAHATHPDAIFCLDHVSTLECYKVVKDLGFRIPADMAFASFDETEWMTLVAPPITAVRQPVEDMARSAWTCLKARMTGDACGPMRSRLRCSIEFRGSTKGRQTAHKNAAA